MTEAEWHESIHPQALLGFLRGGLSERKLRLFASACCRDSWHLLTDPRSRHAVEVAERFADGVASEDELRTAAQQALVAEEEQPRETKARALADAAGWAASPAKDSAVGCAMQVAYRTAWVPNLAPRGRNGRLGRGERNAISRRNADILRDITGNPFQPVAITLTWIRWRDSTALRLAQASYDEGTFDRLPILADALEDAGCADRDILDHCRGPGPHVRGCWVVDLILGKQ
jgi:hypothetical protein